MTRRTRRFALGLAVLAVLAAVSGALAYSKTTGSTVRGENFAARGGELPRGVARKFDHEVVNSNFKDEGDGPNSAGDQEFDALAYPYGDVTASQFDAARSTFQSIKSKGVGKGKNSTASWYPMGPSQAQYPAILNRHGSQYWDAGRVTAEAIAPTCSVTGCRLYIAAAGGGVWRTDDALSNSPHWTYISGSFAINSIGSMALDPSDPTGNTLYVGTGEFNACGSGCVAGVGIYKTTDGGNTWSGPLGGSAFKNRGVGTIAIDPTNSNIIYAGSGRALRGHSSTCCDGAITLVPGAAQWGLYKSIDGGATWTFIHNGSPLASDCGTLLAQAADTDPCSPRGVRHVVIDPTDHNTLYASSYARGIWRSNDAGVTWTQIKPPLTTLNTSDNTAIAVTTLPNGDTRMYAGEGISGSPTSRVFRSDSVRTGTPIWTSLTSSNLSDPGYGTFNYCTGQCWYDNEVVTPPGHPDMVYVLGSYQYGESPDESYNYPGNVSNGRGVVLSQDAGATWTDQTEDATSQTAPNGLHPDQHALVVNPNNPLQFWEGSDGGVMRSSGTLADTSSRCDSRNLSGDALTRCKQLLSAVPSMLTSLNKGLSTLQFQSLSVNPANVKNVMGGTQDNGTFQTYGSSVVWPQIIFGDGGQSGFDATNPDFRVHTYTSTSPEVNFHDGNPADWIFTGDPIEAGQFYSPLITDPVVHATMYMAGNTHVWRTKTDGIGPDLATANQHCNELTGDFSSSYTCGDWVPLDGASLVSSSRGNRSGGAISAIARTAGDTSTLWAGTDNGRVFIAKNADAEPASSVSFARIDTANTPNRFVSSIYVSPTDPNTAWISYSGFSACGCGAVQSTAPGHVFKAVYDPGTGTATWTDLSYNLDTGGNDLPITGLVRDDVTGDLYASNDFGVLKLASGDNTWTLAATGMPNVEVAGLTIMPSQRKLYAASHGMGAWSLTLP